MGVNQPKILVVGGGVSGLSAAIRFAECGAAVILLRSSSLASGQALVGRDDGIAQPAIGDGVRDRLARAMGVSGGLADRGFLAAAYERANGIVDYLDRIGVPFDRTGEGRRLVSFDGELTAGIKTGRHVLAALESQARRLVASGRLTRLIGWEFVSAVCDGRGACRGVIAQDLESMTWRVFKTDAVVICGGDYSGIFGARSVNPMADGFAAARLYRQGASFANAEFVSFSPFAVQREAKSRLLSDDLSRAGARPWVPRGGAPWYFADELAPDATHESLARAVCKVVYDLNLGVDGGERVNLDASAVSPGNNPRIVADFAWCEAALPGVVARGQLPVFWAASQTLGGLWTDAAAMTGIPGIFTGGGCSAMGNGAGLVPGDSLLLRVFGGMFAAEHAWEYASSLDRSCDEVDEGYFLDELRRQEDGYKSDIDLSGPEHPRILASELGALVAASLGPVRRNASLKESIAKLVELKERIERCGVADKGSWRNRETVFVRHLRGMTDLAHAALLGALLRDESRGTHFKQEFIERDDAKFLKTTKARWGKDGPQISYEDVTSGSGASDLKPTGRWVA